MNCLLLCCLLLCCTGNRNGRCCANELGCCGCNDDCGCDDGCCRDNDCGCNDGCGCSETFGCSDERGEQRAETLFQEDTRSYEPSSDNDYYVRPERTERSLNRFLTN